MIAEQSIEALKNQLDIIEVVSHYIELKKIGATFKACCPFHQEKTPSFVVNQNKGFYHCFGCGASGDSIAFVMQYEKLNYKEAIEKLAQLYNFTLTYEKDKNSFQEDSYRIMEFMREYYQNSLTKEVESYIQSRGITLSTQQKFELGYAGQNYEIMATLQKHSINLQEALNLGILGVDNENGAKRYYARLTQRLIFPIRSPQNKIVGFGGRTLGNHPAKYINSPQTKLFNKSQILYGYPQAKETIYKKEEVIVTEGYLDVIMLHQAGFTNAVATLGTALTKEHLPLLSKGNPKVILAYDGDNAGMNAAFKAASLLSLANKEGGVVLFDGGLDPADMVKNGDIARLKELFLTSIPFIDFVLEWIIKKYDLDNPLQKDKCLQEALEYLQHFSLVIQEDYKGFLAQRLKLPSHLIRIKKNNQKEQIKEPIQSEGSFDLAEKAIIKSVLEDMNLLEFVMDFLEPTMFFSQKEAYLKLLKGELEDPSLIRILLDNKVKAQDKEKLKQQMIMILYQYYEEQKQKVINEKQLSLREKSFLIRKYQKYLDNLKKGDLIVYEGFSTF
ncbi:DNA primase [Helicobacter canadensis]|uniref:DNA primase n=1 Tax=Helicobacter canadensis MIT 98-5491 TaxID=537970 RepID=C5ZXC6_9HELI|nr:DNA primase [Helicobacter canadensis]EES89794.1 DNA primase [Helicobacter canadensis MIT 98-5491]EFR48589.1 DNA primase [Helicobacter canadensis MIT 98-5491]STO99833.1 DNA primase [Helicobacter canadensis]